MQVARNEYMYVYTVDLQRYSFTLEQWVTDEQAQRIAEIIVENNGGPKPYDVYMHTRTRIFYDGSEKQEILPERDDLDD